MKTNVKTNVKTTVKETVKTTVITTTKKIMFSIFTVATLGGCVSPGIGLNKGRLLDPTMDPAKLDIMGDSNPRWIYGGFERSSITTGGTSGSACPTCR